MIHNITKFNEFDYTTSFISNSSNNDSFILQGRPVYKLNNFQIVNLILSTFIIIINSFVIYLFYYKRNLLNTPSNRLLLSLAVSDLTSGYVMTFHVLNSLHIIDSIAYRIVLEILNTFLVETVIMHLCGITLDRFLSLFYALRYRDIVTKNKSTQYIIIAWLLPLFTSSIQLTWLYKLIDGSDTDQDYADVAKIEIWYSMLSFLIFHVIPMILLGIVFVCMFIEIRRLLLKTPNHRMRDMSGISVQQRRVFYIFGFMYICFSLFSTPYFVIRLIMDLNYWINHNIVVSNFMLDIVYTFKAMTSLTNPIIYTAINREFRSLISFLFERTQRNFRKLSSNASFLNVSMRRRSMPISSIGEASIHDSGIYELCLGDTELSSHIDSPSVSRNNGFIKMDYNRLSGCEVSPNINILRNNNNETQESENAGLLDLPNISNMPKNRHSKIHSDVKDVGTIDDVDSQNVVVLQQNGFTKMQDVSNCNITNSRLSINVSILPNNENNNIQYPACKTIIIDDLDDCTNNAS